MYKVYRKYKKNGFQNTLKMAKMCSLRGTVPPPSGQPDRFIDVFFFEYFPLPVTKINISHRRTPLLQILPRKYLFLPSSFKSQAVLAADILPLHQNSVPKPSIANSGGARMIKTWSSSRCIANYIFLYS